MKERPILFTGPMVRAILEGRKTQTRRPVTSLNGHRELVYDGPIIITPQEALTWRPKLAEIFGPVACPFGQAGDRLWVRETFVLENTDDPPPGVPTDIAGSEAEFGMFLFPHYRATEPEPHIVPSDLGDPYDDRTRWSPAIFMPRWASRITLEITNVRIQRVQDITYDDCRAEGIHVLTIDRLVNIGCGRWPLHRQEFYRLWDDVYAKGGYGWDKNPWVWVVEFRRLIEDQ